MSLVLFKWYELLMGGCYVAMTLTNQESGYQDQNHNITVLRWCDSIQPYRKDNNHILILIFVNTLRYLYTRVDGCLDYITGDCTTSNTRLW